MTNDIIELLEENDFTSSEIVEILMNLDKSKVEDYAISKGICPICFSDLGVHTWKESRGEFWGFPCHEEMSETYCQNCGYNL